MSFIGIDLGGTRIKMGLIDEGILRDSKIISAASDRGLESHLSILDREIEQMLDVHRPSPLSGIALAFPGLVNYISGKVLSTNKKYADAPKTDLNKYYLQKWGCPFFIDNDARMATVGEWKLGAGRGSDDLVMVTLGTGIGTSVIIDGKLLRGKHFQAGCLGGHFTVNYNGRQCTCSNSGCVEAEAAGWSLPLLLQEHKDFDSSVLKQEETLDFYHLFKAAAMGDPVAREIKEQCVRVWAAGIISYIHAYDPELIILGGGVAEGQKKLIPEIGKIVNEKAWTPWGKVKIKPGELGDYAGVIGAVYSMENKI